MLAVYVLINQHFSARVYRRSDDNVFHQFLFLTFF